MLVLTSLSPHGCCKEFMYGMEKGLNTSKDKYQPSQLTELSAPEHKPYICIEKKDFFWEKPSRRQRKRCLYPKTFPAFGFLILSKFPINTANKAVWTVSGLFGTFKLHHNLNDNMACTWLQQTYSQLYYNKDYKPQQNAIGHFKKNTKRKLSFSMQGLQGFFSLY